VILLNGQQSKYIKKRDHDAKQLLLAVVAGIKVPDDVSSQKFKGWVHQDT
jgi:hypothetical protein